MPDTPSGLTTVHYIYLLKEDQEDMSRLWSSLTEASQGQVAPPDDFGLTDSEQGPAGYCHVVHRVRGADLDLCLVMLADLAAIQIIYHGGGQGTLAERWSGALALIEADRQRLESGNVTVFGETTLLIAAGGPTEEFREAALAVTGATTILETELDPDLAGGRDPSLLGLLGHSQPRRDFFALTADTPEAVTETLFPQLDSLIKKLARAAAYFEEQRNTIIKERTEVDREVGALLHQQVVSVRQEAADTSGLEQRIDALSRMFGMLATDSLLVRQAGDRLEQDISKLDQALGRLAGGVAGMDEIGSHFLSAFRSELGSAREEAGNLEFSRQNAQAAIEVVRTQVELLRAGEEAAIQDQTRQLLSRSLVLQKERLALQVAAGFVEFVLVFYYVIKSWEAVVGIEPVEHIAPVLRLIVVGGFSASAAVGTHFLAQTMQSRSYRNPGLWISIACLVLSFAAMVILTIANE